MRSLILGVKDLSRIVNQQCLIRGELLLNVPGKGTVFIFLSISSYSNEVDTDSLYAHHSSAKLDF